MVDGSRSKFTMAPDSYLHNADQCALPGSDNTTQQQGKVDVALKGVAETLLISLAARAFDATTDAPILGDSYAQAVLEKLEYNVEKATLQPVDCAKVALRTRHFDQWTASFLAANPHSTVLHLACGLDSRVQRVEWGSEVCWIDFDLPEVIALRRQVLPVSFSGRDYRLIGANVTDSAWLEDIPSDRPTVVIMEGLLSYLLEEDVEGLLLRLVERLPKGELLFHCLSTAVLNALRKGKINAVERTGAQFHWAIDDLKKLEDIHSNLELLESVCFVEAPGVEEFPFKSRATMYLLSWLPASRNSVRFVRFGFGSHVSRLDR